MFRAPKLDKAQGFEASLAEPDVFWPTSILEIEPESELELEPEPSFYVAADLSDEDVIWIGLA